MSETVVLTGTIAPSKNVVMTPNQKYNSTSLDPKKREKEYYEAIKFYLEKSDFTTLIFCDNSNYDFSYADELQHIAKEKGKTLELLKFQGDVELVTTISHGVGEAEIFDFVYENSKELHKNKTWFKVTGRYIISNINEIIKKLKEQDCYFQKWIFGKGRNFLNVSTATFKISNKIFEEYLYKNTIKRVLLLKEIERNGKKLKEIEYLLEYIFYSCLRNFLLKEYKKHTKKKAIYFDYKNKQHTSQPFYKWFYRFGIFDFNFINNILDRLFYCSY